MESHSRGLRLRTAHPIRFPGTPSPKGTKALKIRQPDTARHLCGSSIPYPQHVSGTQTDRLAHPIRLACGTYPVLPVATGHPRRLRHRRPRSLQSRQTIRGNALRNGFRTAGNEMPARVVPIQPYLDTLRPENCRPASPRTQETKDLRTRNFRREPESVPDPRPTERPAERPGAVGLESKSGKRSFRTARHQRGVIAFGK